MWRIILRDIKLQRLEMQWLINFFSFYVIHWLIFSDEGKLLKDLNENFMVRELGMIASGLSLNYGKYMAIASAALLTVKKC